MGGTSHSGSVSSQPAKAADTHTAFQTLTAVECLPAASPAYSRCPTAQHQRHHEHGGDGQARMPETGSRMAAATTGAR